MCDFISCVELYSGNLRYLTTEDLETERGRRLSSRDISGHGAVREYYRIDPHEGRDLEFVDFTSVEGFPDELVNAMKAGQFKDVGVAPDALGPKARAEYKRVVDEANAEYKRVADEANAECNRVVDPARAEYNRVTDEANAEYHRVANPALVEYHRVADPASAEYRRVVDPALAEYHRVADPALAECNRVTDEASAKYHRVVSGTFWALWTDSENRLECWR